MDSTRTINTMLLICLFSCGCSAQLPTFNETWNQKKTQKKYLREQVAALKVHLLNVKKGVDIIHRGWTTIQNIKDENFNIHRDFISSLKKVNPHIANSAKVADIVAFQVYTLRDMRNVANFCKRNGQFTAEEIRYVAKLYTNMVFLCDASISELVMIVSNGTSEMKDDERMRRVDALYEDLQDKRTFARCFSIETQNLARVRAKERAEVRLLESNHN